MREALAEGRVLVDREIETNGLRKIGRFTRIELDGKILQGEEALYLSKRGSKRLAEVFATANA